jgi:GT2 family glycosyltransferase
LLTFTHSLVICSRGRSENLSDLLKSISSCVAFEEVVLIIVLNGHTKEELISLTARLQDSELKYRILESEPGLAAARNVAIKSIKTQLVSFLDDDVLLPQNYLLEVDKTFANDTTLDGLSPRITGLYNSSETGLIKYKLRYSKFGRITSYGENFWIPDKYSEIHTLVKWLPGCSMSYRFSSIAKMQFSEELMLGPTAGYSLGEDVDFSIRLNKLVGLNTIAITHVQAKSVRDNSKIMAEGRGRWKAYLARNYPKIISFHRTFLRLILEIFYLAMRCTFQWRLYYPLLRNRQIQLTAFIQETKSPILVRK